MNIGAMKKELDVLWSENTPLLAEKPGKRRGRKKGAADDG